MNIEFRFVWIDDKPDRAEGFIGALDGTLRNTPVETKLEVVGLTERLLEDMDDRVDKWRANPPNLIMLDHNFSTVSKRKFDMHGSALAHLLRLRLPNIPIVCVSGLKINSDEFNIEDISEYTCLFDVNRIAESENLETLFAVARDFPLLCFPGKQAIRKTLVEVLKAPIADREDLCRILPEEFEGKYIHGNSPHRIASWVLNVFLKQQGFLYDSLEAATLLGLSEKAFVEKVSEVFKPAIYCGPFSTGVHPRWWASALADILYSVMPDNSMVSPQEAGRKLKGIVEADFSKCAVSGQVTPAPDVVAFTDSTRQERKPVRNVYTEMASEDDGVHPGFAPWLKIRNDRRGN